MRYTPIYSHTKFEFHKDFFCVQLCLAKSKPFRVAKVSTYSALTVFPHQLLCKYTSSSLPEGVPIPGYAHTFETFKSFSF